LGKEAEKCSICGGSLDQQYHPMEQWNIKGLLCGRCYSRKISEFYPGTHERVGKP